MNISKVKPCRRGHIGPRYPSGSCIECDRLRYKSNPKHRERIKANQAIKRAAIREDPVKAAAQKAYMQQYAKANKDRLNEISIKAYHKNNVKIRLQGKGILATLEVIEYVEGHSGNCDICGNKPDGRRKSLSFDHCHTSGVFRGMLCTACNLALGYLKDDPQLLRKALAYIEHYQKDPAVPQDP